MIWEVVQAKNGIDTLLLNSYSIYSKYRPVEDAEKWMSNEFDTSFDSYFLIGLGLGYHLRKLAQLETVKPIIVYYFEQQEYDLFVEHNKNNHWWKQANITLTHDLQNIDITTQTQILIPNVWLKAIGPQHPLLNVLEDIKINQLTYKKFAHLMHDNFEQNRLLQDVQPYPIFKRKIACLVASGPSLNETVHLLANIKQQVEIFAVGSALKMLLAHEIEPTAVVISDAKPNIVAQLRGTNYKGMLFYLSTANYQAVLEHSHERFIMCQQGYDMAEQFAHQHKLPLLETGGSVATVAVSLLETLGFEKIILFGQDLGFSGNQTHASLSTSGRVVTEDRNIRTIPSNDGSLIQTTPNLHAYLRWFENKTERTTVQLFNTAYKGAAISNVPYVDEKQFYNMINDGENL